MKIVRDLVLIVLSVVVFLLAGWQVWDYTKFRQAGSRYTATDGTEACQFTNGLAEFVGYPDRLDCDYENR